VKSGIYPVVSCLLFEGFSANLQMVQQMKMYFVGILMPFPDLFIANKAAYRELQPQ